jgi:hypothetical protein
MVVGAKRLLPQSGNAIFRRDYPMCVSFKHLKHWKNGCRRETPPAAERQRHFSQRLSYVRKLQTFEALEKWLSA